MEARVEEHTPKEAQLPGPARQGLELLYTAYRYVTQLDHDLWDFAVEIASLRGSGLTTSDLRWLLCMGYAAHARETTLPGETQRAFHGQGGLTFYKRSCFVLTELGLELAMRTSGTALAAPALREIASLAILPPREAVEHHANGQQPAASPAWDGQRHRLSLGGVVIKEFKVQSPNQETVLAAFEEEGWPPRIDDPLPLHAEIDPKRRLHDTIKSLNRNQKNRLIRFMGDGSGEAIRWEPIASHERVRRPR